MAPAIFRISERQQHLRDGQAVAGQCLLIGVGQSDLPGGGGGLFFLEPQRARRQIEMASAHGDGAR